MSDALTVPTTGGDSEQRGLSSADVSTIAPQIQQAAPEPDTQTTGPMQGVDLEQDVRRSIAQGLPGGGDVSKASLDGGVSAAISQAILSPRALQSAEPQTDSATPDDPIQAAVGSAIDWQAQQTKASVIGAVNTNPDQYANAMRVAKITGLPVQTVLGQPDLAKQREALATTDYAALNKFAPATAALMSNIDTAKIAHDDVQNLTDTEGSFNIASLAWDALGREAPDVQKALAMTGPALSSAPSVIAKGVYGTARGITELMPYGENSPLANWFADQARLQNNRINSLVKPTGSVFADGYASGMQSLGVNLLTLPAAAGGTLARSIPMLTTGMSRLLTFMGITTGGAAVQDAREKGINPYNAALYGLGQGGVEAATERFGMPAMFSLLKPGSFAKKAAEYLIKDQLGEQAATHIQDLNEWVNLHPDKTLDDYLKARPNAALQTAIATLVAGGGQVAIMKTIGAIAGREDATNIKAEQAEQAAQKLRDMVKNVQASKVRQRDTETFDKFVQSAAADSPVDHLYIDAGMLQQTGVANELAAISPSIAEQLPALAETGGAVSIPIEEFATKIAPTEYAQSLLPHLRTEADGFSQAEAQQYYQSDDAQRFREQTDKMLQDAQRSTTFKQSQDAVKSQVLDQLNATGNFQPEVNETYATLTASYVATRAAMLGVSPQKFYDNYGVGILKAVTATPEQYKQEQDEPAQDLYVAHNLTAANVEHALELGGLAAPSIAVARTSTGGFDNFGDITLLADKSLLETPKMYTFAADVYSPRHPRPSYTLDDKRTRDLIDQSFEAAQNMGETYSPELSFDSLQDDAPGMLERSYGFQYNFLKSIGKAPKIKMLKVTPETKRYLKAFEQGKYGDNIMALPDDPQFQKDVQDAVVKAYANTDLEVTPRVVSYQVRQAAEAVRRAAKGPMGDYNANRDAVSKAMESKSVQEAFQKHITDTLAQIVTGRRLFKGFSPSGNRRYADYTMQNILREMVGGIRNQEGMDFGAGSVRAGFAPQLKGVKAVKSARDRIVDRLTFNQIAEDSKQMLENTLEDLQPFYKYSIDSGRYDDDASKAISEGPKGWREAFNITPESEKILTEFTDYLRGLPTDYFEAKAQRAVGINEFHTAVVPKGTSKDTMAKLKAQGLVVKTYDPNKEGDRTRVIAAQKHLLFQDGPKAPLGVFDAQSFTIGLLKGANLSTYLHEAGHYFFENDIRLANEILASGNATEGGVQLLQDVSALLDWHGIKGDVEHQLAQWANLSPDERRSYHETTAESFEHYLFTGKAPSIELTPYFQKFRAFLTNVYKSITSFLAGNPSAGKLNDTVKGVFDRMLATNEQIETAEQARDMADLFRQAADMNMTIEAFQAYQALGVDAAQDAIQMLQSRSLRNMQFIHNAHSRELRRLKKEVVGKRAQVQIEARTAVMAKPVYQAWDFLTRKLDADNKLAPLTQPKSDPKVVEPAMDSLFTAIAKLGGLDRGAVKSEWGHPESELGDVPQPVFGKRVFLKQGGLGLDAMAERLAQYGYLPLNEHGQYDMHDFEDAVESELGGSPVYSDRYDPNLTAERKPGDQVINPDGLTAGRIDRFALSQLGMDDAVVERLRALKMTASNGLDPDYLAGRFGFENGADLVQQLADATPMREAIEDETDLRMLQQYGDLTTPQGLQRAADEAIHNQARQKQVSAELTALEQALGDKRTVLAAAKRFAADFVARFKVRDIKPTQFASAAAKARKAADKAFRAGNLAEAAMHKRNELVQSEATVAAYKAQGEIAKALRYLNQRANNRGGRIPAEFQDQIDEILVRFDLRKSTTNKAAAERETLQQWIESQHDLGNDPAIPASIANEAYRKPYKEMTLEELRDVVDAVKNLEYLGRNEGNALANAKKASLDAQGNEIKDSINSGKDGELDNRSRANKSQRTISAAKGFLTAHLNAASIAHIFDRSWAGPMWEYMIRPVNDGGNKQTHLGQKVAQDVHAILQPLLEDGHVGGRGRRYEQLGGGMYNKSEIFSMLLNLGNAGNAQRLVDGEIENNWSREAVESAIEETLTKDEIELAQHVWDYYETLFPELNAMERRINGVDLKRVEPTPSEYISKDGETVTLRGGYYPIIYDTRRSARSESDKEASDRAESAAAARMMANVKISYSKPRADEVKGRPLQYGLAGVYSGFSETVHALAYREALIDANKLLRRIEPTIRKKYGPEIVRELKAWLQDIAIGDQKQRDAAGSFFAAVRRNVPMARMGYSLTTAAQQVFGYANSIVRIGPEASLDGALVYMRNPRAAVRETRAKSTLMADRRITQIQELNDLRNRIESSEGVLDKIRGFAYYLVVALQTVVDTPTWHGEYRKVMRGDWGGRTPEEMESYAVARADQAVIDSQGSGMIKDMPRVMRGSDFQKLFTVYFSYMSTTGNLIAANTAIRSKQGKLGTAFGEASLAVIAGGVLAQMAVKALTPGDSGSCDTVEDCGLSVLKAMGDFGLGLFVGFRELSGVFEGYNYNGPAGLSAVGDARNLYTQMTQGELDDGLRKALIIVGGDITGLPSVQVNKTITGIQALNEGKTTNPLAIGFGFETPK